MSSQNFPSSTIKLSFFVLFFINTNNLLYYGYLGPPYRCVWCSTHCSIYYILYTPVVKSFLITPFLLIFYSPPSSVVFWLRELCLVHEAECTIMLQSKPIGGAGDAPANSTYNQTHLGNFWAGNSKDTIRAIQSRAHAISAVFAKLCK